MISVGILPLHPFRHSSKVLDGARPVQADNIIENIDLQLLSGLEFQRLSNLLRYYNLEFWRHFDHVHGCSLSGAYNIDRPFGMSICLSMAKRITAGAIHTAPRRGDTSPACDFAEVRAHG